jgi:hypothetical protein
MRYENLLGAVAALAIGQAAQAQPPAPAPPPSQPVSPAPSEEAPTGDQADVSATAADFRPGMAVKDPSGLTIGRITRVGQTPEGETVVEVDLDGRPVNLSPSVLSLNASGDAALSSMTKAEIRAADARSPP